MKFFVTHHDLTLEPIGEAEGHQEAFEIADEKFKEDGYLWLHSEQGLREYVEAATRLLNA